MPRVSLPAAPASERKQGVCAAHFSGSVTARREGEAPWLAPAPHLAVGALVLTVRDRGVEQVRQPELPLFELGLHRLERRLRGGEACGESLARGDERGGVVTPPLGGADR